MGELCLQSLRRFGQYEGDCLVITDTDYQPVDSRTHIWKRTQDDLQGLPPHLMRLRLPEWEHAYKYTKAIYLDADQLVIKPIQPLFDAITDCILVCCDYVLSGAPTFTSEFHNKKATGESPSIWFYKIWALYFKEYELCEATKGCGINSGFFGLPSQCFDILTYWLLTRKYVREARKIPHTNDQTALNFLLNNDLAKHKMLPLTTMLTQFSDFTENQKRITADTTLLHFCGLQPRLDNMTKAYHLLNGQSC